MTADSEESALAGRARRGDRDSFAALVRAHETNVRRLAAGILLDEGEAEDAAQEVFVKAWQALPRFRGESSFSTWIHRIAVNHCRDRIRARGRWKWLSWDGLVEKVGGEPAEAAGPADAATGAADARDAARSLLAALSPDAREVLVLREIRGLSYAEMAETLEITVDAVKARLKRARAGAREILARQSATPDGFRNRPTGEGK